MPNNKNITILKNPLAVKNMVDIYSFNHAKIGSFEVVCRLLPASRMYNTKELNYFLDNTHVKEILDSVAIGSTYHTSNFKRDGAIYHYINFISMPKEEEIPIGVAVPKSQAQTESERAMQSLINMFYVILK